MLVVCGRRHGLICSVTRMRAWTPLRPAERATYDGLLAVEAVALDATRPGERIGDVVSAIAAAYPANGFAADEWHQHHQGGPTGYAPRDYLASPAADALVADPQAFAWNPSGGGFKVEDTVLATAAGSRSSARTRSGRRWRSPAASGPTCCRDAAGDVARRRARPSRAARRRRAPR